jgi:hypothetical protein
VEGHRRRTHRQPLIICTHIDQFNAKFAAKRAFTARWPRVFIRRIGPVKPNGRLAFVISTIPWERPMIGMAKLAVSDLLHRSPRARIDQDPLNAGADGPPAVCLLRSPIAVRHSRTYAS